MASFRVTTRGSRLNVRTGPGMGYRIIGSRNNGEVVQVHENQGDWARIGTGQWVHGGYLVASGPTPPGPTPPSPTPPGPAPRERRVCGPDVTEQVAATWSRIQTDFRSWSWRQKVRACNTILVPVRRPEDPDSSGLPSNLEELKQKIRLYADTNGWDTLPLFQGDSDWLRSPPVYDPALRGPCATPSSAGNSSDPFDPEHENPSTCSNTVQVRDQCWLNGTVNYGTFGIMVRLCRDFAWADPILGLSEPVKVVYSLAWATMLIRAYKRFGADPEAASLPIAWTNATFRGGPRAVPTVAGNRPTCQCSCGCTGDVVDWDYVWEPVRPRNQPYRYQT